MKVIAHHFRLLSNTTVAGRIELQMIINHERRQLKYSSDHNNKRKQLHYLTSTFEKYYRNEINKCNEQIALQMTYNNTTPISSEFIDWDKRQNLLLVRDFCDKFSKDLR